MNTGRVRLFPPLGWSLAFLIAIALTGCAERQPAGAARAEGSEAAPSAPAAPGDETGPARGHATYLPPGFASQSASEEDGEPTITMTRYIRELPDPGVIAVRTYEQSDGRVMASAGSEREISVRGRRAVIGMTRPDDPAQGVILVGWHESADVYVAVMSRGGVPASELRRVAEGVVMEGVR